MILVIRPFNQHHVVTLTYLNVKVVAGQGTTILRICLFYVVIFIFIIPVFINLLVALTTPHPGIRQCAINVIEVLGPVSKEADSPFAILAKKILHCRAELTDDEEYVAVVCFVI